MGNFIVPVDGDNFNQCGDTRGYCTASCQNMLQYLPSKVSRDLKL